MNVRCPYPGCLRRCDIGNTCATHNGYVPAIVLNDLVPIDQIYEWPPAMLNRQYGSGVVEDLMSRFDDVKIAVSTKQYGRYQLLDPAKKLEAARRLGKTHVRVEFTGIPADVILIPANELHFVRRPDAIIKDLFTRYHRQVYGNPVLVDEDLNVLDGHKRATAASELGWLVPCTVKYVAALCCMLSCWNPPAKDSAYCQRHYFECTDCGIRGTKSGKCITCQNRCKTCSNPKHQSYDYCLNHLNACSASGCTTRIESKFDYCNNHGILCLNCGKKRFVIDPCCPTKKCQVCSKVAKKGDYCKDHKHPSTRGLVRCLSEKCKVWITEPTQGCEVTKRFCATHRWSEVPIFDRDGDPIWLTADKQLLKIRDMGETHLTNTLLLLEANAKRRCQITNTDISLWAQKTGPRYQWLVTEAKARDQDLNCQQCVGGLIRSGDRVVPCSCVAGKKELAARRKAVEMAKQSKRERAKQVAVLMLAVVTSTMAALSVESVMRWLAIIMECN